MLFELFQINAENNYAYFSFNILVYSNEVGYKY